MRKWSIPYRAKYLAHYLVSKKEGDKYENELEKDVAERC
jgi:hypothetical protein